MAIRNITHEGAIFNLWLNWIMAQGALILPIILSVYIPTLLIPPIVFALMGLLILYRNSRMAICSLVLTIVIRSLFMSGIVMIAIALIYSKGYISEIYDESLLNFNIPYLPVLIISPVTFVNAVIAKIRGHMYSGCRTCFLLNGAKQEKGLVGRILRQETRYQQNILIAVTAVSIVATWLYYFCFYINVNINTPDKFFFGWLRVILYILSVIYLGMRYFTLWAYYYQDDDRVRSDIPPATTLRYLLIWEDSLFLSRSDVFNDLPDTCRMDTPAKITVGFNSDMSVDSAAEVLCNMSGLNREDFHLRFMYRSEETSGNRNVYHYICCPISRAAVGESSFEGEWYNLSQVDRLLHNREFSPLLAAEINRLYTVTMAWKTYDREGRRLYKVKNYRPLFRLKGICDWDVDFNSSHWLHVAQFNEDKRFFRLRRLWHKCFSCSAPR